MNASNGQTPTPQHSDRAPARVPVDFEAILASMQDQIDDLTTVIESHRRRLDAIDNTRKG